jgi:hypothetical protein
MTKRDMLKIIAGAIAAGFLLLALVVWRTG